MPARRNQKCYNIHEIKEKKSRLKPKYLFSVFSAMKKNQNQKSKIKTEISNSREESEQ
jgi:hypothetical protein